MWRGRYNGWYWPWPGSPGSWWAVVVGLLAVSVIAEGIRWLLAAR